MDHMIRPIITEKSMTDAKVGKFTFAFPKSVRKENIKKRIEEVFKVHVTDIATSVIKSKRKRVGKRREEVRIEPYKKATVKLMKDEKISLFEIGEEK